MKPNQNIFAFDTFIIRTPLLSVDNIEQFRGVDNEKDLVVLVKKIFEDPLVKEALYIASRDFFEMLEKWCSDPAAFDTRASKKIVLSFLKYYNRMCTRCTPFGLFSGCSVGAVSEESLITVGDYKKFNRYTRLDTYVICTIIQHIAHETEFRYMLKYYPNTSMYRVNNQYRYVEYHYAGGKKIHELVSVEQSDVVDLILGNIGENGIPYSEMIRLFEPYDVDPEQVKEFIDDMIKSQLLISELEPSISGENLIDVLLKRLADIETKSGRHDLSGETRRIISILENIKILLAKLDMYTTTGKIEVYEKIQAEIEQIGVKVNSSILFQVDMGISFSECTLGHSVVEDISIALDILSRFSPMNSPSPRTPGYNLTAFVNAFTSRYEDAEVPLMEVLDNEIGIGYVQEYKEEAVPSPLLDDILLPAAKGSIYADHVWDTKVHSFFFDRYIKAITNGESVIALTREDLDAFPSNLDGVPDTFSAFVSIVSETPLNETPGTSGKKIILHASGGTSACNLIGRFCFLHEDIYKMALELTAYEKERNPDMVVAEICHLPDTRLGNILLRPNIRDYEIPYLSNSNLPKEQQVEVNDLMVSVHNGVIYLRSKKLNKYVLPRLSSAHYFSFNSLPAYHFLSDLQTQQVVKSLYLNFGILTKKAPFFPRVVYKNLVLSRAWWRFKRDELFFLKAATEQEMLEQFTGFKEMNKLPDRFILVEDDQELYIDVHIQPFLEMFFEIAKKRESVALVEDIFSEGKSLAAGNDGDYLHEMLVQYGNRIPKQPPIPVMSKSADGIQRSFLPGGVWQYFKIYAGLRSADKIIVNALKTFLNGLVSEQVIKKWFFIRYGDPDAHIRLRVLSEEGIADSLVSKMHDIVLPLANDRIIWKLQLDTYNREVERYNYKMITESETVFFSDSQYTLGAIDFLLQHPAESYRWYFALCNIDHYLDRFGLSIEDKCTLIGRFRDSFLLEFNANPPLKLQLDAKFKTNKDVIAYFLSGTKPGVPGENPVLPLMNEAIHRLLQEKDEILGDTIATIAAHASPNEIENLLSSYLHMHVNRLFPSKQRLHEMIIYYVLHRYYTFIRHTVKAKA